MGLMSKLTAALGGSKTPSSTGLTPRDRKRRSKENRRIDAGTAVWERAGGIGPRKGK